MGSRVAPLLPFVRAPDVQDLLELMDLNWYGVHLSPNTHFSPSPAYQRQSSVPSHSHQAPMRLDLQQPSPSRRKVLSLGPNPEQARQTQTIQQVPNTEAIENGLGTWAQRQKIFSRVTAEEPQEVRNEEHVLGEEEPMLRGTQEGHRVAYGAALLMESDSPEVQSAQLAPTIRDLEPTESGEDADINAAWRWRFSRKWQQEQLRAMDGSHSAGVGDDDEWSTALSYMAAAAGGVNLQFGRITSHEMTDSLTEQSLSQSMLLDASLSRESLAASVNQDTLGQVDTPLASRRIAKAVRQAEQLMVHQEEIERRVAEQWDNTNFKSDGQQPWAAQSIPAVNIDSWGAFTFILARVMDVGTGKQKLLIRGRNRSTITQVGDMLQQEVTAEAMNRRLSVPRVDVLGSGKMEWSRERDRCLLITGCAVHSSLDTRLRRKEDVGRVAGALARTGLPTMNTVIVTNK